MTCEKCDYREIANCDCEKTFCMVLDHKGFFGIEIFGMRNDQGPYYGCYKQG